MQEEPHGQVHHTTAPVVEPGLTFASVTDKISSIVLKRKTPLWWFLGFAISFALFQLLLLTITNLLFVGIGLWGVNIPVAWGMDILNFVWWIGIGHAGTLISAILLLLRQQWRTSINRFAEAMTLFAVAQAGMYPVMHLGRPWLAYWLFPYLGSLALASADKPKDFRGNCVEGQNTMGQAGLGDRAWHAPDCAGELILG